MTYIPDSLREEVAQRANYCCEYCLIHERDSLYSHEVDHIVPEKHRGKTVSNNLCYACLDCNRFKGSDFASFDPETNDIVRLYNPRNDIWADHFQLGGDAQIIPKTPQGRVTEFVLKLNAPKRVANRRLLSDVERYPPSNSQATE